MKRDMSLMDFAPGKRSPFTVGMICGKVTQLRSLQDLIEEEYMMAPVNYVGVEWEWG